MGSHNFQITAKLSYLSKLGLIILDFMKSIETSINHGLLRGMHTLHSIHFSLATGLSG